MKPLGRTGVRWWDKIKINIKNDGGMYGELFWLRIEISSEYINEISFFHKIPGIFISEGQSPSQR